MGLGLTQKQQLFTPKCLGCQSEMENFPAEEREDCRDLRREEMV